VSNEELGGAVIHARASGVASLVVANVEAAHLAVEQILSYLPNHFIINPEIFVN
jgi:acetyl-CoA carboxylase carboxyltransferase component